LVLVSSSRFMRRVFIGGGLRLCCAASLVRRPGRLGHHSDQALVLPPRPIMCEHITPSSFGNRNLHSGTFTGCKSRYRSGGSLGVRRRRLFPSALDGFSVLWRLQIGCSTKRPYFACAASESQARQARSAPAWVLRLGLIALTSAVGPHSKRFCSGRPLNQLAPTSARRSRPCLPAARPLFGLLSTSYLSSGPPPVRTSSFPCGAISHRLRAPGTRFPHAPAPFEAALLAPLGAARTKGFGPPPSLHSSTSGALAPPATTRNQTGPFSP